VEVGGAAVVEEEVEAALEVLEPLVELEEALVVDAGEELAFVELEVDEVALLVVEVEVALLEVDVVADDVA